MMAWEVLMAVLLRKSDGCRNLLCQGLSYMRVELLNLKHMSWALSIFLSEIIWLDAPHDAHIIRG